MAFPPMGNSDHVFVSVSLIYLSNSKRDGPFIGLCPVHQLYDYSHANWDGFVII